MEAIMNSLWAQRELFARLLFACFCGGIIGLERSIRRKDAGIKTHIILALGAALFMIVSQYGFSDLNLSEDPEMIAKVCYEIGNRHATLFWGENAHTFITPYNEPTLTMLNKLHGVTTTVETISLDFSKAISSSINAHTHG